MDSSWADAEARRYFSTWGPKDGPIRNRDCPGSIGIVAEAGAAWPILGQANPCGVLEDSRGAVKLFKLIVAGQELPGQWKCDRREFVPFHGG